MHVWGKSVTTRACARAAAGSDARMGGCSMPVVINSGSGNQGMTVSLRSSYLPMNGKYHMKALSFSRRQQSDCHSSEILYWKSFRILRSCQRCLRSRSWNHLHVRRNLSAGFPDYYQHAGKCRRNCMRRRKTILRCKNRLFC